MQQGVRVDLTAWVTVGIMAILAALPWLLPEYLLAFAVVLLLYMGMALSWNLCSGYTGYVAFGHHGFFGLGAYTVGVMSKLLGGMWWIWGPAAGGLMAAAAALPIGAVLMRVRGVYFAIATLGFAEVAYMIALNWDSVTGGTAGLFVVHEISVFREYAVLYLVVLSTVVTTWWLERSAFGLRVLSMREDEEAAASLGIDTVRQKLWLFTLSAFFAGAIGGAYVDFMAQLLPGSLFTARFQIIAILLSVAGGVGSLSGVMIGSGVLGTALLVISVKFMDFQTGASGLLLLLISLLAPHGMAGGLARLGVRVNGRRTWAEKRFLAETPKSSGGSEPKGGGST